MPDDPKNGESRDLVTYVEFGGKHVDVEFRISEMVSRAEQFIAKNQGGFGIPELAMAFADCFVLGTIRERERVESVA